MTFQPGQSGNPGGRPGKNNKLSQLCRDKTDDVFALWIGILNDPEAPKELRVKVSQLISERGWGKPAQSIEHSSDPENPPVQEIRITTLT